MGAAHLRSFDFVDKSRIAHVGFSWGAMTAVLTGSRTVRAAIGKPNGIAAFAAFYPGCSTIRPPNVAPYEIVNADIDRPLLVLMGDQDTETPAQDCVPKLRAAKLAGAPVEWHVYGGVTHCWDCQHLDGFAKINMHGRHVVYRYDADETSDSRRRLFEFLDNALARP